MRTLLSFLPSSKSANVCARAVCLCACACFFFLLFLVRREKKKTKEKYGREPKDESQKNTDFASFQENILEEKSAENGTAHLRALARENPNIKHLTCHVTIDIHKKKWTIIVSYGGAKYRSPYLSKARQRFFTSL